MEENERIEKIKRIMMGNINDVKSILDMEHKILETEKDSSQRIAAHKNIDRYTTELNTLKHCMSIVNGDVDY